MTVGTFCVSYPDKHDIFRTINMKLNCLTIGPRQKHIEPSIYIFIRPRTAKTRGDPEQMAKAINTRERTCYNISTPTLKGETKGEDCPSSSFFLIKIFLSQMDFISSNWIGLFCMQIFWDNYVCKEGICQLMNFKCQFCFPL